MNEEFLVAGPGFLEQPLAYGLHLGDLREVDIPHLDEHLIGGRVGEAEVFEGLGLVGNGQFALLFGLVLLFFFPSLRLVDEDDDEDQGGHGRNQEGGQAGDNRFMPPTPARRGRPVCRGRPRWVHRRSSAGHPRRGRPP